MINKHIFKSRRPLIAILRGVTPLEAESVSEVLIESGISIIEIPLNSPKPFETIARMVEFHGDKGIFGAGTVLTEDEVSKVADVGGKIIVSPNSNPSIIKKTKELSQVREKFFKTNYILSFRLFGNFLYK